MERMHAFNHGYALLIGVDASQVAGYALPAVASDIAAVAQVLAHPDRCGYPAANVKTLTGPDATRGGILDGLAWLAERLAADASGDTTAIIYYSGHGWRRETGASYLLPYDVRPGADGLPAPVSALAAADFAAAVAHLASRRLLVLLDCCHASGMGVKGAGGGDFSGTAIPPALLMGGADGPVPGAKGLDALARGAGRAVLSSSQGAQPSYLRGDGTMSIFTYHLIEALTGHARPAEGATEVLVSDIMSHVWRRVPQSARADWGVDQQPDYQVSGNFPVALLLGGSGVGKGAAPPDPLAPLPAVGSVISQTLTGRGVQAGRDVRVGGDLVLGDKVAAGDGGAAATHGGVAAAGSQNIVITGAVGGDVTIALGGRDGRGEELAYLDGLVAQYRFWVEKYTPLAGVAVVEGAAGGGPQLDLPALFMPTGFDKLVEHGFGDARQLQRKPVADLREAVQQHRRLVVLGEPGSGKTTTLWRLAYDYALAAQADPHAPLPLLIPLSGYTGPESMLHYLQDGLRALAPGLADHLDAYLRAGRALLLLDGLNEMPRHDYRERVALLRAFLDRYDGAAVVVTCRALDYDETLRLERLEIKPLAPAQQRIYLQRYLGDAAGDRLFW